MISSYKAAQLHMEKARSKAKGRPMKSAGWRLFQADDGYVVTAYDVQVGRFLPDNTFQFSLNGEKAHRVAHTLSATMHRNLPFYWFRVKYKTYRVDHRMNLPISRTDAPTVYDGLKFDLHTGECLNYLPEPKRKIDPERRKEWLAASRAWKRKLKAAARVGVFDGLITQEQQSRTPWFDRQDWGSEAGLDILYKVVKTGDCSVDTLRMFVASETISWGTLTSMQMYERIEKVVKAQSIGLRRRFGVFEGE